LRIEVTGGPVHDSQVMDAFLDRETLALFSDKAYGSTKIRLAKRFEKSKQNFQFLIFLIAVKHGIN